jgi:hypothetical protein
VPLEAGVPPRLLRGGLHEVPLDVLLDPDLVSRGPHLPDEPSRRGRHLHEVPHDLTAVVHLRQVSLERHDDRAPQGGRGLLADHLCKVSPDGQGRGLGVVLTDVLDRRESPRRVRVVEARTAAETPVARRTARLSEYGRLLLATRVIDEGWTVSTAAEAQGVSRMTGRKWVRRYQSWSTSPTRRRERRPCPRPLPLRSGWYRGRAAPDRQRLGVPLGRLPDRPGPAPAPSDPAPSPADQRRGRAVHRHPRPRVGVRAAVQLERGVPGSLTGLRCLLQSTTPARNARRTFTPLHSNLRMIP